MLRRLMISAAVYAATILPAVAHPGHDTGAMPLAAGLMHPLLGPDHVLAMLAVGLWAAHLGGRALWLLPATFVIAMAGGFALAVGGIGLPLVEPGIAASVLILGLLLAAALRLPLAPAMLLVGFFAMLHGHAHGSEATGDMLAFGLGFVSSTMLLLGTGMGIGRVLAGRRLNLARSLGGIIAGVGLLLLGGLA